jgi:hypothetical protein
LPSDAGNQGNGDGAPMNQPTFGDELRSLRQQRGLSLKKFARVVHFDPGYLSKIENGLKPPSATVASRCDAALDAGGALSALVPAPAASALSPLPRCTNPGMDVVEMRVTDLSDGVLVGAAYVESLHRTIKNLAALDGVHGGADIAPLALRSFRRAQGILGEGRYEPASERDIEAAAAEVGELSGWLLFDAERHQESRQVNAEALTLAQIAGDVSMGWFVLPIRRSLRCTPVATGRRYGSLKA